MSALLGYIKSLGVPSGQSVLTQQVRHKWTDWRMLKDYKKRQMVIKVHPIRARVNTIRKNSILPRELKDLADEEIAAMPRHSMYTGVMGRCALTSKPKGNHPTFRVSRIMFRLLADYNKLSGVQRGRW